MGKFITTTEISAKIEQIIKESQDFIILITPFVQIHSRLKKIIERKFETGNINIYIICRTSLDAETNNWFRSLGYKMKIIFNDNLHAKCYLNEKTAIVTSMNLYQYSMVNNIEFGVVFEKELHPENYSEIYEEALNMGVKTADNAITNPKIKVKFEDLIRDFKPISFQLRYGENLSQELALYFSNTTDYVPIQIDDKINLIDNGLAGIKELITKYPLYLIRDGNTEYFKFTI